MSYRRLLRPDDHGWKTSDWVRWLRDQGVAPSVNAEDAGVCSLCRAPTRVGAQGTPYERCYNCVHKYASVLDGFVPICYSLHDGLEGLLWNVKNKDGHEWLRTPLGSLLWTFLKKHQSCIESYYGGKFDLLIAMPSHSSTRGGLGHLEETIGRVKGFSSEWTTGALIKNDASKADSRRERIVPDLFTATAAVRGKRILLLDDTFTTGGSMASAAYALKQRGAASVVGLTFGRQLRADWRDSRDFAIALSGRELNILECAVHGGRPADLLDSIFRQPD